MLCSWPALPRLVLVGTLPLWSLPRLEGPRRRGVARLRWFQEPITLHVIWKGPRRPLGRIQILNHQLWQGWVYSIVLRRVPLDTIVFLHLIVFLLVIILLHLVFFSL